MKNNKIVVIALALTLMASFIGTTASAFEKDTTIKTIAVLPFTVSIDTNNLANGITEKGIIRKSDINRYRFQRAVHTWFIKKDRKYIEVFKDIISTNDILSGSGLIDSLDELPKQKLCVVLGVDAIITGSIRIFYTRDVVGYEVMRNVVGINVKPDSKIVLEINLHNAGGSLLWKKTFDGYGADSPDIIIDRFLRNFYRTFPYKK